MKKDTAYNVSKGLEALKKRSPTGAVTMKTSGDGLLVDAPGPREVDDLFVAKMDRYGWKWSKKGWAHSLDGRAMDAPDKTRQITSAPAKRGKGDG